jgi:hypothetical protein
MSAWTDFVTAYYEKKHKTDPKYMFKHALKDAAKEYKKKGASEAPAAKGKKPKK